MFKGIGDGAMISWQVPVLPRASMSQPPQSFPVSFFPKVLSATAATAAPAATTRAFSSLKAGTV